MRNFITKILAIVALPFVFIALFFVLIAFIFAPKNKKLAIVSYLNILISNLTINILKKMKKKTENEKKINNKALE